MATRLVALAERAHTLDLEAGDFLNRSIKREEALLARWAEKSRIEALADLKGLIKRTRRAVRFPLLSAVTLVWLALLPLVGLIQDRAEYRFILLCLMSIVALVWVRELDGLATAILEFTRQHAQAREKRRHELTEAGEPFIVSGDPAALSKAAETVCFFGRDPEERGLKASSFRVNSFRANSWGSSRSHNRACGRLLQEAPSTGAGGSPG